MIFKPGSTLYYALLAVEPSRKLGIIALCELFSALWQIRYIEEKSVAQAKLAWWRLAIQAFLKSAPPEHPLLQTIAKEQELLGIKLPLKPFDDLLLGFEWHYQYQGFETLSDTEQYAKHLGGAFSLLITHWLGFSSEQTLIYGEKLGMALFSVSLLQNGGQSLREGYIVFPREELTQFGVIEQELLSLKNTEAWQNYCDFWATRSQTALLEAIESLPKPDRKKQKPGLILAKMALYLLGILKKEHYPVLDRKIDLTPFRKAWISLIYAR